MRYFSSRVTCRNVYVNVRLKFKKVISSHDSLLMLANLSWKFVYAQREYSTIGGFKVPIVFAAQNNEFTIYTASLGFELFQSLPDHSCKQTLWLFIKHSFTFIRHTSTNSFSLKKDKCSKSPALETLYHCSILPPRGRVIFKQLQLYSLFCFCTWSRQV